MASTDNQADSNRMTGAEIVLRALKDNGVEHIFGYPGGAVLPIYDEIFQQDGFLFRLALTLRNFLSINCAHENSSNSYCGGKAHGQDGVTIRR